jgi:hypothetical protein
MLYNKDKKQRHEGIAIELALIYVFASIGKVRPFAIIIDKHKTSLDFVNEIIDKDVYCWTVGSEGMVQVVERVLSCHFHVMKA